MAGISEMTWKRQFNAIRAAAGLIATGNDDVPEVKAVWDQDLMRHSFASYWLAVHQNAPTLAEIMGNTVPIIRRHYESTVLEDVAVKFWTIRP